MRNMYSVHAGNKEYSMGGWLGRALHDLQHCKLVQTNTKECCFYL